jgi:hypothetical protein
MGFNEMQTVCKVFRACQLPSLEPMGRLAGRSPLGAWNVNPPRQTKGSQLNGLHDSGSGDRFACRRT